jgi:hypothetical protein
MRTEMSHSLQEVKHFKMTDSLPEENTRKKQDSIITEQGFILQKQEDSSLVIRLEYKMM